MFQSIPLFFLVVAMLYFDNLFKPKKPKPSKGIFLVEMISYKYNTLASLLHLRQASGCFKQYNAADV